LVTVVGEIDRDQIDLVERPLRCRQCREEQNALNEPDRLRELADWYREFAERTANPTIWDARLRTAEDLEAEATRIEQTAPRQMVDPA
jgi:hypothetical protein